MNNSCPSCGAIYNVASKDVGRKIKCKKCSAALVVTEAGLEEEGAVGRASDPKPAPAATAADDYDDEPVVKKKKEPRFSGPRTNPLELVGGIPTLLFAFGVFLVIVFTSLPIIGTAGSDRAQAYVDKLDNERNVKKLALLKGKKIADMSDSAKEDLRKEGEKIDEEYGKKMAEAKLDADSTKIANRRDVWMERYGLMFGFVFVSFGCIGYLRTEQPLVLKITAAAILTVMMIIMFVTFGGGCGGRGPIPG